MITKYTLYLTFNGKVINLFFLYVYKYIVIESLKS